MILIADSGATKTDWRMILSSGQIEKVQTLGFNPFFNDSGSIYTELKRNLVPALTEKVEEVFFYGAGCSSNEKNEIVRVALITALPEVKKVEVQSDLLGAARALSKHEKGIVCILGTGANSCLYDGKDIIDKPFSLGFWLGDEGSGGYLGKKLIIAYLRDELPDEIRFDFDKEYQLTKAELMDNIYKKPNPNRYVARFAGFIFEHLTHPYVSHLVKSAFHQFFEYFVCRFPGYNEYPIHFTGSVAFYYQEVLRFIAAEKGLQIGNILESPITGLTWYHSGT
jgi:N-acetylglucosamine kinase-like BadF-type ATPase